MREEFEILALSSLNCNRFLGGEDFAGCKVTKDFPRSVVEESRYVRDAPRGNVFEGLAFGKELAEEPVGVLAGAALPGRIRFRKEHWHLSASCKQLMLGELFAIIEGDAASLVGRNRFQKLLQFEADAARCPILGHRG